MHWMQLAMGNVAWLHKSYFIFKVSLFTLSLLTGLKFSNIRRFSCIQLNLEYPIEYESWQKMWGLTFCNEENYDFYLPKTLKKQNLVRCLTSRALQILWGESVSRVTMRYVNVLINYIIPAQLIYPHALFITVKQILTATMNEDNCETSHT